MALSVLKGLGILAAVADSSKYVHVRQNAMSIAKHGKGALQPIKQAQQTNSI